MAKVPHAVTVPLTAVFTDEGKSVVYVKTGNTYDKRDVQTGISNAMRIEIKKGVADGDEVALENPVQKKPGEEKDEDK
jgi:cobalt-zinc-cadmium efflux system membrane fusion protein